MVRLRLLLQAAASQGDVPGSIWAIGIAVVGALTGTITLLFRQLLTSKDDLVKAKETGATAVLAEREVTTKTYAPLIESVGKMATSVGEMTAIQRETRDALQRLERTNSGLAETVSRLEATNAKQAETIEGLTKRVDDKYRRLSGTNPAVRGEP